MTTARPSPKAKKPKTLYVLDTNVLMHDPTSPFQFMEHDVYIPITVFEELDNNKSGMTDAKRNARAASRYVDELVSLHEKKDGRIDAGIPLKLHPQLGGRATGKLYIGMPKAVVATEGLSFSKADNHIIGIALGLVSEFSAKRRNVVLVSKDINVRIKAKSLGLAAEDYRTDAAEDDNFNAGIITLDKLPNVHNCKRVEDFDEYVVAGDARLKQGHCLIVPGEDGAKPVHAFIGARARGLTTLRTVPSYRNGRKVFGVNSRNDEQNFLLGALMRHGEENGIDIVWATGEAGTGKTLLTLAAALDLTLLQRLYDEIIISRVTVSMGEEIGFLPGTEEDKMGAWMGAFDDNLEVLAAIAAGSEKELAPATGLGRALKQAGPRSKNCEETAGDVRGITQADIKKVIKVKSMNFWRGRTFFNKFVIIDEAQNLTPKQVKTLITRVGPGSKMVLLGNLGQIDTPYLTASTSGLAYAIDRLQKKPVTFQQHVALVEGVRSRSADWANENL